MAYYAFLDDNNIVTEVIAGVDETELIEGKTPEQWYGDFKGQTCKRTSYNTKAGVHTGGGTPFRGNYAGIGYKYHEDFDIFMPPQPYPSWNIDYSMAKWNPPIPMPTEENKRWRWSEINKEWVDTFSLSI